MDGIEANAARAYAAGKAAGLNSREIAEIPFEEFPIEGFPARVRPVEEDECFHNSDGPRAGEYQGENPVD